MLYGIRRDLQASLHGEGFRVRVYVPFGREWFPYFMRRLGERPANVGFVIRGILRRALKLARRLKSPPLACVSRAGNRAVARDVTELVRTHDRPPSRR